MNWVRTLESSSQSRVRHSWTGSLLRIMLEMLTRISRTFPQMYSQLAVCPQVPMTVHTPRSLRPIRQRLRFRTSLRGEANVSPTGALDIRWVHSTSRLIPLRTRTTLRNMNWKYMVIPHRLRAHLRLRSITRRRYRIRFHTC